MVPLSGNPNLPPAVPAYNSSLQVIVDSGTTLIYLPDKIATYYNSLFEPSATWSVDQGMWLVSCAASVPRFGVLIGGGRFGVDAADLVLQAGGGQCISAIQPSGAGLAVLGDSWLKNVLVVFDVGNEVMWVSSRVGY